MPTTPILGLPYPAPSDPPDVPTDLRELAEALEGGLIGKNYSPAWSQDDGSSLAIGNGTLAGRYWRIADLVIANVQMTRGSTTNTGTGAYRWTAPVPMSAAGILACHGSGRVNAAAVTPVVAGSPGSGFLCAYRTSDGTRIGSATPGSWAAGHVIAFTVLYTAA